MPKFKIRANVIAEQWDGSEGQLQDLAGEHSLRYAYAPGFTTVVVGEKDGLEKEKTLNPGDYLVWVSKTDPFPAVALEGDFETYYRNAE
jgi:hypothetical protein